MMTDPGEQQNAVRRMAALFDCDPRPTFVLDLHAPLKPGTDQLHPVLFNAAVLRRPRLEATILGIDKCTEASSGGLTNMYRDFVAWAITANQTHCHFNLDTRVVSFWGLQWDYYTFEQRWRVVSASVRDPQYFDLGILDVLDSKERDHKEEQKSTAHEPCVDAPPSVDAPASHAPGAFKKGGMDMFGPEEREYPSHVQLIRNIDWSSTSAGPMETWPDQLHQMCNLMVTDPQPCFIFWGTDLTVFYNEPAVPIIGDRHPKFMGSQGVRQISGMFSEIWDDYFAKVFKTVIETGKACKYENVCLSMEMHGRLEEMFFNYTYLPLIDSQGAITAVYARIVDVTVQCLARRRAAILRQMSSHTSEAIEHEEVWLSVLKAFEDDGHDVPVALMYSVADGHKDGKRSPPSSGTHKCILQASVGTSGGPSASGSVSPLNLSASATGLAGLLSNGLKHFEPQYTNVSNCGPAEGLFQGVPGRAFGEPCTHIVVCPVRPTRDDQAIAFLVVGLNPRKPFHDSEYQDFIRSLQMELSSSAASVILLAEERKRGRTIAEQATVDRAKLAAEVAQWIEEAGHQERRFMEFLKLAPVGVNMTNGDGEMYFANDTFYELTNYDRNWSLTQGDWRRVIYPDDLEKAEMHWKRVWEEKVPFAIDLRVTVPWTPPGTTQEQPFSWVLASNHVQTKNGEVETIITCITDINTQKWAESVQLQRVNDALMAKQEQDEFIDMTSHEMRNPLSAVLQCAEEIVNSVSSLSAACSDQGSTVSIPVHIMRTVLDAAETIYYCTQHQRRIVDDILTMSKLNSGLLPVTPSSTRPLTTVEESIRVYSHEMKAADIHLTLAMDTSFAEHAVDWLMLDRGRLTQIFLNILSNAIKFTKPQAKRWIRINLYAFQKEPPQSHERNLPYLVPEGGAQDPTTNPEWGSEDVMFIEVTVEDSGPGMSQDECSKLFRKFSQATRRTHVQYGGSGLGLFICRTLAEMHGGRVGFTSESGNGSLFGFYIKCRRTSNPPSPVSSAKRVTNLQRESIKIAKSREMGTSTAVKVGSLPGVVVKKTRKLDDPSPGDSTEESSQTQSACDEHDVLIVEDNITNQRVLAKQLQRFGHRVSVTNHGREALDHISKTHLWNTPNESAEEKRLPLSLILSDIEMPVMDGFEFVSEVRRLQNEGTIRQHIPVIAITGNAREEQVVKAKEAGMDDVVLKPFNISALTQVISNLASRSSSTKPPRAEFQTGSGTEPNS